MYPNTHTVCLFYFVVALKVEGLRLDKNYYQKIWVHILALALHSHATMMLRELK